MSLVLKALAEHALKHADAVAIQGQEYAMTYAQLYAEVQHVSLYISKQNALRVAVLMDNTPAVLTVDLACMKIAVPVIPVPLFFSPQQVQHTLQSSAADFLITNLGDNVADLLNLTGLAYELLPVCKVVGEDLQIYRLLLPQDKGFPKGVQKITYTSGSTGDAKGVCLSQAVMDKVASSLALATEASMADRHVCLLPYATLLENIAGMYVPLIAGATICLPGLAQIGMQGSSDLDISRFVGYLHASQATSCVMIPQMLQALVAAISAGAPRPKSLRYIAVGGAPVSEFLLTQAEALGLPVYEGYGLSEASSVVTLNTPSTKKLGSVGRVLPHVRLHIADDGEIILEGELFSGYLGDGEPKQVNEWATGDIGRLDEDGFLYIEGRKKHIFITSFGRNVSPEWVERELNIEAAIAQCCVFGEAKPFNVAVIVIREGFSDKALQDAITSANQRLPDYAQVHKWVVADVPFSVENGQWTGTGRPRRSHIEKDYCKALESLYVEGR